MVVVHVGVGVGVAGGPMAGIRQYLYYVFYFLVASTVNWMPSRQFVC